MNAPMDSPLFREAMSRLGAAVNLITTDGPAGRAGLTATAVCSVTDAPPTLLVCINRRSGSLATIMANGALAINVLRAHHAGMAARFGNRSLAVDEKFAGGDWCFGESEPPFLGDALVSFLCHIASTVDVGSHCVMYCVVNRVHISDEDDGLFYFGRHYFGLSREKVSLPEQGA
ncbi:MAG TPA: flavin reductase [Novosphingobium sp.]|nr:flavin reductase [Novosphingobium sp.]